MASPPAKLRVMGVEEAFNIPVAASPDVAFLAAPGGTGAMLDALAAGAADVALALTESVVAAVEAGSPLRILAPFVASPLTWAICVRPPPAGPGAAADPSDAPGAVWGVSRRGSGSHTMACVLARRRGHPPPAFVVCGDFAGLRAALADRRIDAFLWEAFTTSPFAAAGDLRVAGGLPTPWGCFCAVVDPAAVDVDGARAVMDRLLDACAAFERDADGSAVARIVGMSGMTAADAKRWHAAVRYARPGETIGDEQLALARDTVLGAGVIGKVVFDSVREYCV
jgi:ABC-type nitrate/sulfonate/bicarbonate transport system substrate-binding protein